MAKLERNATFGNKSHVGLSDEALVETLRSVDVKAMPIVPTSTITDLGRVRELNDRAYQFQKDCADVIIGFWACISPNLGHRGLRELERCIKDLAFVGYYYQAPSAGIPINDKRMYCFYDLCREARVPVRLNSGYTGAGAGMPGGGGVHLAIERPIPHFDDVCADFPDLTVICGHSPWPWTAELIAILLHKSNAYLENHGTAPKYLPPELKREINGRLQDRVMFASNYPQLSYERLFSEWEAELRPEVLEKLYLRNAEKVFTLRL